MKKSILLSILFLIAYSNPSHAYVNPVDSASINWDIDEIQNSDPLDVTTPVRTSFCGKVKFEPRFTRVSQEFCRQAPCPKSQVYWSLVIYSGANRFLFKEQLNMGDARVPEFVEIKGVKIRPDSFVKVEGDVLPVSRNLFSVEKVENITLIRD